jgi:hypothetical protein
VTSTHTKLYAWAFGAFKVLWDLLIGFERKQDTLQIAICMVWDLVGVNKVGLITNPSLYDQCVLQNCQLLCIGSPSGAC